MIILKTNKEVLSVYFKGVSIQAIYTKGLKVWPDETIVSCFNGLGGWNDNYPWNDNAEWNDN